MEASMAEKNACCIQHVITEEMFDGLKKVFPRQNKKEGNERENCMECKECDA